MNERKLSSPERRSVVSLALIYALRMFGLFLLLPVLAPWAEQLEGSTPALVGVAIGIYGISQALLQIPFGMMSDRFGRKPVIAAGLLVFVAGSVIAMLSDSITGVIIGRVLQGAGAVAAAVLALAADLTRESQRAKAMAIIGMSIGASFMLALIAAPLLEPLVGVRGMFLVSAILAIGALLILVTGIPAVSTRHHHDVIANLAGIRGLLADKSLLVMDIGIFILHAVLTALFVVVPLILVRELDWAVSQHWKVYIPAMLFSLVGMVPMIILSGRPGMVFRVLFAGVLILLASQLLFFWRIPGIAGLLLCLMVFFWGFNALEALLPSVVSRLAPAGGKGTALGLYNTFQFLGVFAGGTVAGILYGSLGTGAVFLASAVLVGAWAMIMLLAPRGRLYDSRVLKLPDDGKDWAKLLMEVPGVLEASVVPDQGVAYLKFDREKLPDGRLEELIAGRG